MSSLVPYPDAKQSPPRIVVKPSEDPGWENRARARSNVRQLAWLMDSAFVIPGTNFRIGLDALIGLIPFVGDIIGMAVGGYLIVTAARLGVPRSVLLRMFMNAGTDVVLGTVPFAGDVLDAAWKANARNARLLDQAILDPKRTGRSSFWLLFGLGAALLALTVGAIALTIWIIRLIFG